MGTPKKTELRLVAGADFGAQPAFSANRRGKSFFVDQAADAWLAANPGKTLAICSANGFRVIKSGGTAENLGMMPLDALRGQEFDAIKLIE